MSFLGPNLVVLTHLCEVPGSGGPGLSREVVLLHLGVPTVHRRVSRDLKWVSVHVNMYNYKCTNEQMKRIMKITLKI